MDSQYTISQQQVFQKLKNNIDRLKGQKQQLNNQIAIDRSDLNNIDLSMTQLGRQIDDKQTIVRERQRKLMQLEKAINETEKSYEIIVQTTKKLSNALQTQAIHLRNRSKKQ